MKKNNTNETAQTGVKSFADKYDYSLRGDDDLGEKATMESWITENRDLIIEIYKETKRDYCPGLKPGRVFQLTNKEMLEEILKFVKERRTQGGRFEQVD